jgi:hypothetical protein
MNKLKFERAASQDIFEAVLGGHTSNNEVKSELFAL